MPKQITETVVKYTESHHRITVTAKFPNGENLRVNSSAWRASLSTKRPTGMEPLPQNALRKILNAAEPVKDKNETYGGAMKRLAESLKNASSITQAAELV